MPSDGCCCCSVRTIWSWFSAKYEHRGESTPASFKYSCRTYWWKWADMKDGEGWVEELVNHENIRRVNSLVWLFFVMIIYMRVHIGMYYFHCFSLSTCILSLCIIMTSNFLYLALLKDSCLWSLYVLGRFRTSYLLLASGWTMKRKESCSNRKRCNILASKVGISVLMRKEWGQPMKELKLMKSGLSLSFSF